MTPVEILEAIGKYGVTALIMALIIIPLMRSTVKSANDANQRLLGLLDDMRGSMQGMREAHAKEREQFNVSLADQRSAHSQERLALQATFDKLLAEERGQRVQSDARNVSLNDRIFDANKQMVDMAQGYANSTITAVETVRSQMDNKLLEIGARMVHAEEKAERAESAAAQATASLVRSQEQHKDCQKRLENLEGLVGTKARA